MRGHQDLVAGGSARCCGAERPGRRRGAAGYTPIGNALRAAADALPKEGPRSIVLVSDGEDTCAPPAPCDVAKELEQQGVDLTVHTVGFKVDSGAREQLSCIADSTGGTYSDADNATELTDALATKVDYAITGYTPLGAPVTGADQPSMQAPLLAPGQYLDTLAEAGPDVIRRRNDQVLHNCRSSPAIGCTSRPPSFRRAPAIPASMPSARKSTCWLPT